MERITAEWMNMRKVEMTQNQIYPGMLIQYQIQPFLGLRFKWVTEITQVKELEYFIDIQRFVPFAFGIMSIILKKSMMESK